MNNMKEMNVNEMEQVNGGNFIGDVKDLMLKTIPDPFTPFVPYNPAGPDPLVHAIPLPWKP